MQQENSRSPFPLPEDFFSVLTAKNAAVVTGSLSMNYDKKRKNAKSGLGPSTALATAASLSHKDITGLLMSVHCDVNVCDGSNRMTPLMYDPSSGHSDVVNVLLEKGANVNAVDNCNRSAIYFPAGHGKVETVKSLLKRRGEISPRISNERQSDNEELTRVDQGRNDPSVDQLLGGNNAFLKACMHNNIKVVKELLKHDVNAFKSVNHKGDCGLHIAVRSGYCDVTRALLSHKSLLDQRNNAGETPLHVACRSLFTDSHNDIIDVEYVGKCAEFLIQAGCDVSDKDMAGHCALHALLMGSFSLKGPDSRLGRLRFKLVQLILSASKNICPSDLPNPNELSSDLTEEHFDILQWLHTFLRTPRSLQHICRVSVRQTLGSTRLDRIEELTCAPNLVRYISLL